MDWTVLPNQHGTIVVGGDDMLESKIITGVTSVKGLFNFSLMISLSDKDALLHSLYKSQIILHDLSINRVQSKVDIMANISSESFNKFIDCIESHNIDNLSVNQNVVKISLVGLNIPEHPYILREVLSIIKKDNLCYYQLQSSNSSLSIYVDSNNYQSLITSLHHRFVLEAEAIVEK